MKCGCGARLFSKSSFFRHKKECTFVVEEEHCIVAADEVKQEVPVQNIQNQTTTNIGVQNNNTTYNIIINPFFNSDSKLLTDQNYVNALKQGMNCVPALIEQKHFNSNIPENQNVRKPNFYSKYMDIHDGKDWIKIKDNVVLETLYENISNELKDKLRDWDTDKKDMVTDFARSLFDSFIQIRYDDEIKQSTCDEIKIRMHNATKKLIHNL